MDDTNYYENMIAELRAERDALADEVRDLDIELTHARDERNRLRQHLHDEHQRHIGTMDEHDAIARQLAISRDLLMECAQNLNPPWQNPDHPLWSLKSRIKATFGGQSS